MIRRGAPIRRSYSKRARTSAPVITAPAFIRRPIYAPRTGEWKYLDQNFAAQTMTATMRLNSIGTMVMGTTASTRIGMNIIVKTIEIRMIISQQGTTTTGQGYRFGVFLDKQANATAPVATDVLHVDSIIGMRNLANRKRFKILFDKTGSIGGLATASDTILQKNIHVYYKFKQGFKVEFNTSNLGTIADITSNSLWFFLYSNTAAGTTNPICNSNVRIRFLDY